jgi:transcription initiation factor TFIIIB Brf1 subunit/transcription initiation factor TFIIB
MPAASYMPCENCGEGAIVWNGEKGATECTSCGSLYKELLTGPSAPAAALSAGGGN